MGDLVAPSGRSEIGGCGSPASSTLRAGDRACDVADLTIGSPGAVETFATLAERGAPGIDKSDLAGLRGGLVAAALKSSFDRGATEPAAADTEPGDAGLFDRAPLIADPMGGGWAGSPAATRCSELEASRRSWPSLPGGVLPEFTARTPLRRPPWSLPQVRYFAPHSIVCR
jgi:hypothetical protein